jgi:Polyketide synthase dehydratase
LKKANRQRRTLTVPPWVADHAVAGKIVLPAVETLLFLAAMGRELYPELDVSTMVGARFGKFLEIAPGQRQVEVLVELSVAGDHLRAVLQSEVVLKNMTRIKEHGEVYFPLRPSLTSETDTCEIVLPVASEKTFSAETIYNYLVPFGPAYRSLHGTLHLRQNEAIGELRAPLLSSDSPASTLLGSPFPCDGAMHAACVLGQQRASYIPFPVGFAKRRVLRPTRPGDTYLVKATLTAETAEELTFNLRLADNDGRLYEAIDGLRMRDVGFSATAIEPKRHAHGSLSL